MRFVMKKTCRFELRMTRDEMQELTRKARKAGLTKGAFLRAAIAGKRIHEAPSADVPTLIMEVRRVGYNIDQILKLANARGLLDVPRLREALENNQKVEKLIATAYGLSWQ